MLGVLTLSFFKTAACPSVPPLSAATTTHTVVPLPPYGARGEQDSDAFGATVSLLQGNPDFLFYINTDIFLADLDVSIVAKFLCQDDDLPPSTGTASFSVDSAAQALQRTHIHEAAHPLVHQPQSSSPSTIERWIALTSKLNYDELLNLFLTCRTYISAVDLCHLLICRFHWSLSGHAKLRLLLASWLNALVRNSVLQKHQDGMLIKVVKDCKEAHHMRTRRASVSARKSITTTPNPRPTHLGDKFAEAISKDQDDSDVDLDFVPDDRVSVYLGSGESGNAFQLHCTVATSLGAEYSPAEPREHICFHNLNACRTQLSSFYIFPGGAVPAVREDDWTAG
ncbi:hypothetical protein EDC04DRAFT_2901180 [Pisolithus marmoratus]|nr:hypothetical protein EDC04DRAFT_2901180 [Pisolithus marmoratus]